MSIDKTDDPTFRYAYEREKQARAQLELLLKTRARELQSAHQQLAEQNEVLKKSASELRQVLQILKETKDELRVEAQQLPLAASPEVLVEKTRKVLAIQRALSRFYRQLRRSKTE